MSARTMMNEAVQSLQECGQYYDVLYDFTKVVVKCNALASEGETDKILKNKFRKLLPVFILLCGGEVTEPPKKKPKPKTVLQVNLKVRDGWGLCPTCGKKCIKVHDNTILVNYPMFCKACKRDYMVTWKNP